MSLIVERVLSELELVPEAPDHNLCLLMAGDLIAVYKVTHFTSWWEEIQNADVSADDVARLQQKLKDLIAKPVPEICVAGAIWALGKLHNPLLKPYFVALIKQYRDPPCYDVLHNAIVAIGNFEDALMRFGYDGLASFEEDKIVDLAEKILSES